MRDLRTDIQALRALAVTLVVVFHFWATSLPGGFIGVDVFFVISGFLITGHLLRDVAAGRFSVADFWARRVRRLIPASFLVLFVTALVVLGFAAASDRVVWLPEIGAAAGYFENWKLAFNAVDYLALGNTPSPVQHFWSLSAEEQFYFLWPLLIVVGVWLAARIKLDSRVALFSGLLLLTLGSLAFSIYYTHKNPAMAYFVTPTRVWEFGVGALVAFAPRAAIGRRVARFGFTLALVTIIAAAFQIRPTDAFPSYLAAWPVVATAAAIWLAPEGGLQGRLLGWRPVQVLGEISYSVYLWHWPVLVLVPVVFRLLAPVSPVVQTIEILATLLVAWMTRRYVEVPFIARRSPNWRSFTAMVAAAAALIGGSLAAVTPAQAQIDRGLALAAEVGDQLPSCVGAAAVQSDLSLCSNKKFAGLIIPPVDLAPDDSMVRAYTNCPGQAQDSSEVRVCSLGDANSKIKIALIGDSHANQYAAAVDLIGKQQHWSVDVIAKGGCPLSYSQRVQNAPLTNACRIWVKSVVRYLDQHDYRLIVTSMKAGVEWHGKVGYPSEPDPVTGIKQILEDISNTRIPVVYIKDNPAPLTTVEACLMATQGTKPEQCSVARRGAFEAEPALAAIQKIGSPLITVANFDNVFCGSTHCLPIIGNVVVYRDDNHLTNTFVKTLSPRLASVLAAAIQTQG